jgi:hypothetical protein
MQRSRLEWLRLVESVWVCVVGLRGMIESEAWPVANGVVPFLSWTTGHSVPETCF